jgi:hypothetical protein
MFSTRFLRHAVLFAALGLLVAQIVATALMVNRAKDAQIAAVYVYKATCFPSKNVLKNRLHRFKHPKMPPLRHS